MRELVILDGAIEDFRGIARYIAKRERSTARGSAFAKRLADKCAELAASTATRGRLRQEFGHDLRCLTFLSYLIFFRYVGDRLEVAAFIHGARDLAAVFAERDRRE